MNIQSLSVVVPTTKCINNCAFCVAHMKVEDYKNQMDDNLPFFDLYLKDYLKRLEFARHNGCNTVMLTGNGEPQQNRKFLTYFGMFMQMMSDPFQWIEMQTTGVLLDNNYLRFLRNHVGVNLISLSVSSFAPETNRQIIGCPENIQLDLFDLCKRIKTYDFSLRLSVNLTSDFNGFNPEAFFNRCEEMGADQVTLRILYSDGDGSPQAKWVKENSCDKVTVDALSSYVRENGTVLGVLPYGATKYALRGMSVVIDDDCMAQREKDASENYKYLILRPDCKLYSQWEDKASLIF